MDIPAPPTFVLVTRYYRAGPWAIPEPRYALPPMLVRPGQTEAMDRAGAMKFTNPADALAYRDSYPDLFPATSEPERIPWPPAEDDHEQAQDPQPAPAPADPRVNGVG